MDRYLEGHIQALINVYERESREPRNTTWSKRAVIEDLKRGLACNRGMEKLKEKEEVKVKSFITCGTPKDIVEKISIALNEGLGGI